MFIFVPHIYDSFFSVPYRACLCDLDTIFNIAAAIPKPAAIPSCWSIFAIFRLRFRTTGHKNERSSYIYVSTSHTYICRLLVCRDLRVRFCTCDFDLRFVSAIYGRDPSARFVSVLCIRDWKMRFVLAICRCDSKMRFVRALSSCDFMTVILSAIHENDVRLTCYDK